ncbi:MAG TPA: AMP-binding protein, partial [Myxococcota bacterium]|nr:AMP-binding protein [Myxococcota bacterium]
MQTFLEQHAAERPDQPVFTFLEKGEIEAGTLTFAQLYAQAAAVATLLAAHSRPGDRALLLYDAGLTFIPAFLGCLMAGVIAVPAPLPAVDRPERSLPRLRAIRGDARPRLVLGEEADRQRLTELLSAELLFFGTDRLEPGSWKGSPPPGDAIACLQYTSGSTGQPRGVALSHHNLIQACASIQHCGTFTPKSVQAVWVPHLHDYGLIEGLLHPLYTGLHCYLMPPAAFVQAPLRWLQAISRYGVTHSGGPDFAYDLCVRRIAEAQRQGLDLSRWRWALNAAEPIRAQTLRRFAEAFGPYGFSLDQFQPAYGLAEATLQVSNRSGVRLWKQGEKEYVSCGFPALNTRIEIVDAEHRPTTGIGEVWVSSPSVATGYYQQEAESFGNHLADGSGPFLRTGDLGFLQDGELFITGRTKDQLILHGQKYHPQDVEWALDDLAAELPGLKISANVAFSVDSEGGERLVLLQEFEPARPVEGVIDRICVAVAQRLELRPHTVWLLPPGSLPRTTSGKRMRQECRRLFIERLLRPRLAWSLDDPAPDRPHWQAPLEQQLVARVAALLELPPQRIDPRRPFAALGMDSVRGVQFLQELDPRLSPTLL